MKMQSYPNPNLVANSTNLIKLAAVTVSLQGLSHFNATAHFPICETSSPRHCFTWGPLSNTNVIGLKTNTNKPEHDDEPE